METVLVVGQVAVDERLLERNEPVGLLRERRSTHIIGADLADQRIRRLERDAIVLVVRLGL